MKKKKKDTEKYLMYAIDSEGNKSDSFLTDDTTKIDSRAKELIRKKLEGLNIPTEKLDAFMQNVR